jgi:hypothetical protein
MRIARVKYQTETDFNNALLDLGLINKNGELTNLCEAIDRIGFIVLEVDKEVIVQDGYCANLIVDDSVSFDDYEVNITGTPYRIFSGE